MAGLCGRWAHCRRLCYAAVLLGLATLVAGERTDSTKSTASGNGLQYATAGVLAEFTVTAKDESGVRRTSGGDEFIVELEGTRPITGSVTDNLDGSYAVHYTPTKSGNYEAGVKLAKSGGLTGQYFENVWFFYTPVKTTVTPTIKLDWGLGRVTDSAADYVSVRWQGKVKPLFAETHTFSLNSDDGAKLWVDNVVLIDRWDSTCNETSGTIVLKPHVFYNIKLEYKEVTGTAFVELSWATQSTPKEIIPASQLYYETHVKQSPFSFLVSPNIAVGAHCWATGEGLALATAGTSAQLTLQANDVYDNERGEGGDIFSVRVFPPNSACYDVPTAACPANLGKADGRPVHAVVVDEGDSSYVSEYTQYVAGYNTLYATLLTRGGVAATYYDNHEFISPVKYSEDTMAMQKVQMKTSSLANNEFSITTIDNFAVRWMGSIAPVIDSVYTFSWDRGNMNMTDRVKIWVDNSIIINQWTSLGPNQDPSGTIDLRSSYYYDLRVDYKVPANGAAYTTHPALQWEYAGMAKTDILSSQLFRGQEVSGTPSTVFVHPAGTCAAKSFTTPNQQASGHSLELATAGLQAEFKVTAKDLYNNLRCIGGEKFKVRLTGVDSLAGVVEDLADSSPGAYRVIYTATKSGTYDVSVVFGASGVRFSPFRLTVQPARRHLINSPTTGQALSLSTAGMLSTVTITVRDRHENWQPDPAVALAGIRFTATQAEGDFNTTWTNQEILQTKDKPFFADLVSYIGDPTLAGSQIATPTSLDNPRLILRYTITRSGKYSMNVGGSGVSHESAVMGSPFGLTIFPGPPCSVTSTASSQALSLATAGIRSTFTIQARDMYGNERGVHVGDNFVARVRQYYGSGTTDNVLLVDRNKECSGRAGATDTVCESWMTYNSNWQTIGGRDKQATVVDQGDSTYVVSYDVTRSGTNYVWASLARAGGLHATYYISSSASDYLSDQTIYAQTQLNRIVQTDNTVDFSVTSAAPTVYGTSRDGKLLGTTWAARWTGLVLPSQTEVYTFYAGGDVSNSAKKERVKLWVDNSLIIQQWSSLASTAAPSGSIKLEKGNYYEVLLAAKTNTADTSATAKMQLKWSSFSHQASIISSSRLFVSHHISGSPFPLYVEQSDTCAATSRVFKAGLSVATAGITAIFTIQGRDAYDNKRLFTFNNKVREFEWALISNASLPPAGLSLQNSVVDGGEVAYKGTVVYLNAGGYQVNYTATRSEKYNIRGRMLSSGGIFGTYFENEDLSDHATAPDGSLSFVEPYARFDPKIDFDWGLGRPIGDVTNGTAKILDAGILLSGDTVAPYDQVTLDPNTASDVAEAYVGDRLLINGEERTIITSSPASNVGTAAAGSTTTILQLASSASTVDHFYVGWTAKVFNASDNSFETRLITVYNGTSLSATLASPLSYGGPAGKPYSVIGARVVKVSAPFLLPVVVGAKYVVADTAASKDIGPDYFSARWEGMIKVDYSEVFTFSVYCDDGARLYVNDLLILDHWYSRISEVDGTIALVSGSHYPIKLEYKQVTGNASVQLRWKSRSQPKVIVPSSAYYSWTTTHTLSNSNGSVYVEPAKVCSTTSTAFGPGLSVATAGITAYFTIQARDEYLNNRKTADAGIRPGQPGKGKLAHYGTCTFTNATVLTLDTRSLDDYPPGASTVENAYKGFRLYLDGKDHHDEYRTIVDYTKNRVAILDAPFTNTPGGAVAYKVVDLISRNEPDLEAFRLGFPEFHTRVEPLVDGGEIVLHHIPMRLSGAQYPGGLTATYYDAVSTTGTDGDWSLSSDVLSRPRWSTECSSGRPCDYTIDFSESAQFKRKQYGDECGVEWAGKVNAGVTGAPTTKYEARLDSSTACIEATAYLDHYILFRDGTCRGRWAKITQHPKNLNSGTEIYVAVLDLGAATWSDGSDACKHGTGDAYEIYQGALIGGQGPISKPLFPRFCAGGTELTRGWKVYEPSENPTASLDDSVYAVRWSGMISATEAGVYTFFADLPTANTAGAVDDRVKLWIDDKAVIMQWTSLSTINRARTGTFSFDNHPSMHKISVHYKNVNAGTSGLQLRWQSRAAGHRQAFSSAFSGTVPASRSSCNNGVYSAQYCRLGNTQNPGEEGAASSQVANLYNMHYIKFTSPNACNGRWTRIGTDSGSGDAYNHVDSCVRFSSATWMDGGAGCTCSQNDQFKLVEWLSFPGTVRNASNCVNEGHSVSAPLTSSVSLADFIISLNPEKVSEMKIVVGTHLRINDELLRVSQVTSGTLNVTRGQADTTKTVHMLGATVYALSEVALEAVGVPNPGTTFASHIILFTTGACKGRWANITIYDPDRQCVSLGGTNLGGGHNWLDGKGACTVGGGDKYLIKFGIDANFNRNGITNSSGAAGALSAESWLTTVGSLQAHTAACPLGKNSVHLGLAAPTRDQDFDNHYIRFTSGTCAGEWARIASYEGSSQCATLEWESLGTGSASGQKTSVVQGLSLTGNAGLTNTNITELDTIISLFANVISDLDLKAGSYIQVDSEIMLITGLVPSDKIMVERAQEGTGAVRHMRNSTISLAGLRCSFGDSYTIGVTSGGPIVPSTRLFPLASRYETSFTPTIKGDYQVHSSLAQGSGLDATFYDDQELTIAKLTRVDETLDFDVVSDEVGFHGDYPRSLESKLSDRLSFSVRWAGLLQLDDHLDDSVPKIFTFESSIAETDERVKLWIDNSLIIDRWETYDHLSATSFSATIGLQRPNYYDLKMEYKQYAGSHAEAVLKWHCGIAGSACEHKSIVPSSNLFHIREVAGSPFPPFSVEPAPTCASRSTLEGPGLSSATAGMPAGFTIQSADEYDNDRGSGGDTYVVRAVPFNTWDKMEPVQVPRTTKDCLRCPQTIFGTVKDLGDSTYEAEYMGTKRGHYKVLTSLALSGGLFATYYAGAGESSPGSRNPKGGISAFHRSGQLGDSERDFVSPCHLRDWKNGVPLSTYECASPGYDWTDTNLDHEGTAAAGTATSITLANTASAVDQVYTGMHIALYGDMGDTVRVITNYVGSTKMATVANLPKNVTTTTQYTIVSSKVHRNSGWIKGGLAVGGNRTSIRLPASGAWSHFDTEPYSATVATPNDGKGQVRAFTSVATHGGVDCTIGQGRVRLDAEASGLDGAYTDRYIKFTSGNCTGRWTKIQDFVGPGNIAKIVNVSSTATIIILPPVFNHSDNYYKAAIVCVIGGTNIGECRTISSSSAGSVTVDIAFSANLDTTSVIKIMGESKCAVLTTPWSDSYGGTCTVLATDNYKLTGGWQVVITEGTCKGQYRRVANYEPEAALDTHTRRYGYGGVIRVDPPWDTASQANGNGPYGERPIDGETETISYNYQGCPNGPDATSQYSLIPAQKAPGSIASVDNTFAVRWAGFVKPTTATEYTFLVQMPNAAAGQERVKLWLDNKLVIDQWTSLSGCLPSATMAFTGSPTMLYDLQMEYKRLQNSPKPPRIKLTWQNSLGGAEVAPTTGGAGNAPAIASSRLFTNIAVPNNDLVLYIESAGTESRASSVSGKGLTAATAGIQASFTITSRDEYANLRDLDEDSYIVSVNGPNTHISVSPDPLIDTPGTYAGTHLPTESGDYRISVERAQPGGLVSEWFNNMWLMGEAADSSVSEVVDFNWGKEFVTFRPTNETRTGNDYVSVRWKGYFKAELSEIYTFHAVYQDGLVMYIDGSKVIDNWAGVNASDADTSSPDYMEPTAEARATLSATAGHMYPITLEYREVQSNASCKLFYSSASVTHTIVPSSRLYHSATHVFGSPFKLYVNPAVTCGPKSGVVGAGLSHATAGLQAAFTIQARDLYENTKTKWEDTFVVRSAASGSIAADALGNYGTMAWSALSKHGTISADVTKGRYIVRYTPTAAADVTIFSSLVVPGGVFATYYYDALSATYYNEPLAAATVQTVSAAHTPTVPTVASYTVRWSGLFRPRVATTHTFQPITTGRADKSDRVRLWVDSKLIIDQWTSLADSIPTATVSFPLANEYYELQMFYRAYAISSWGALQINSGSGMDTIGSDQLFMSTHVVGSPFTISTKPAATDFATSIIYGEGLTIATAGVPSSFTVQVKDAFNNLRKQGGDEIQSQLASVGTGAVVNPKIVDNGDGTYAGSFMPSTQGMYDLSVFLGSTIKTGTLLVEPGHVCSVTSYTNGLSLTVATAGYTATFTIQSKDAFKNLRTLGNDNFVVRLSGPGSGAASEEHNVRSNYIGMSPNSNLGRFTVSFRATKSGDFKISVQAATGNGLAVKYFRDPELQKIADEGATSQLDFDVGDHTSNANVAVVDGFSMLWSGYVKPTSSEEYTFHTKVAEADERVKLWIDDQWVVDQWTSLSSTAPTGTLWLAGGILYDLKMQYKEVNGHSATSLHWESSSTLLTLVPSSCLFRSVFDVQGSPFTATVFPARTSGTISVARGQSLSLATAGTAASFTVQAKDHMGNLKTTTDDIFVVRAKFNGKHSYPTTTPFTNGGVAEQSRNRVGTVVNTGPGQYVASYIATWKRNHLSDDGWDVDKATSKKAGQYGDFGQSGIKKKFHDVVVSQAVQGGLMATYYSSVPSSHNSGDWSAGLTQEPWDSPYRTKLTPVISQAATSTTEMPSTMCVDDVHTFGIRYSGFLSPPLAQRYTFQAKISDTAIDTAERVRLWIDNVLVIDQWASLSATQCGAGCFQGTLDFSTASSHHDLVLEYKETATASNTNAKVQLEYKTGATGAGGKLDECVHAMGAAACSACEGKTNACTYDGSAVLIPSARLYQRHDLGFKIFQAGGLTATYYDNHVTGPNPALDGGVSRVTVAGTTSVTAYNTTCQVGCLRSGCPGSGFTCTCNVTAGSVTSVTVNAGGSGYSAVNPPVVNCMGGSGQLFFVHLDYAEGHVGGDLAPKKAVVEPVVDWSGASATDRPYPDSVTDGQFAVRWMGFVKPSRTDEYTFHVPLAIAGATSERVRLWVDDLLIIDQWASMGSSTSAPSGTIRFPTGNEYYNIQLDYKVVRVDQASRGLALWWENYADRLPALYGRSNANASDAVSKGLIRSDRLFQSLVTSEVKRDDRDIWETDYYDPAQGWVHEDRGVPRTAQWAKTNGCPSSWGTATRGNNLRYLECRGQGTWEHEVLRVDVRAAALCAATSNVLGVALTISTAGITRTFTLTARDAYDNQRDSTDDSFIARATLNDGSDPNQFHGSLDHQDWAFLKFANGEPSYKTASNKEGDFNPIWDQNGKYEITYAVSRSGTFQHTIKELDSTGTGLWGSYFHGKTLDQQTAQGSGVLFAAQQDSNIAFDWGTASSPVKSVVVDANGWSARWTGYVRPKFSDLYTFSVLSDGGAKVYIDGVRVLDNWASTTEMETTGTIALTGSVWYDMQIEYMPAPAVPVHEAKLQLSWDSPQQEKQLVPTDRLRSSATLVGPESAVGGANGGFNILDIHPTVVCATTSDIRGSGLSIATAGIPASFTVWTKDMYGNLRDDTHDLLFARMFPDDALSETGVTYGGTGLQATYYDLVGQSNPRRAAASGSTIDFSNRVNLDQLQFNDGSAAVSLARAQAFSARWAGLVRPSNAGVYTFHIETAGVVLERVRLWVDDRLILDSWTSLQSSTALQGTYNVVDAGDLYRIQMTYRNPATSTAKAILKWEAANITAEKVTQKFLYPCKYASGLNNVGASCDSDSKIQTQTTDNSANKLEMGDSSTSVGFGLRRLTPTTTGPAPARNGPFVTKLWNGNSAFAPFQGNRRPFTYVQTRAGSHTIAVHEVAYNLYDGSQSFAGSVGTGLMATYYETPMFGTPRNAYDCQQGRTLCNTRNVDFSTTGLNAPFSLIADGAFSVRWSGMIRAPDATPLVTYSTPLGSTTIKDERVKLWIDNSLLIDQWTSLQSTNPSAALLDLTANQLYDIKLEYKNVVSGAAEGSQLKLMQAWSLQSAMVVPSTRLYSSHAISGTAKRVRVNPAVAFSPACEVHGLGLTLSTAGIQATFMIQSKDAYNNRRGVGGDLFIVRAFSDGCQTVNPGRDNLCDGFSGITKPDGGLLSDIEKNGACSDTALCAPYPPQVASNGPNLLGDWIPGGSYLGEIKGLSLSQPESDYGTGSNLGNGTIVLDTGELTEDHAYVGATLTFAGASCNILGTSREIVAFNGATKMATLSSALATAPGANCKYSISNSTTVVYLAGSTSISVATAAGSYDSHRIRFLTGPCIDRWTTVTSYSGSTEDPTRAMLLGAQTTSFKFGRVLSQSSASTLTLGGPTLNTSADYRGMWITVRDSLGASMGQSKIANNSATVVGYSATVVPPLSAASGAYSYVIHGWDDGGRPCENYGWGLIELIPPNCDRIIDEGVLSVVTSTSQFTLGASASLTADAYKGYYLSVDGSGEQRKIKTYSSSKVATVMDAFTSSPTAGDSRYTVRGCTGDPGAMLCANCPRIVRADVIDNGDSTYSASFTATRKGQYSVVTSLVNAGGVTATYYNDLSKASFSTKSNDFGAGSPVSSSVIAPNIDWSAPSNGAKPRASLVDADFGVRWVGFVRPSRAQQYTFHMVIPNAGVAAPHIERVKLWVDNSIIIQQWSSLSSTAPSGTIAFGRGDGYYDISALYKCASQISANKCGYTLQWESTVSGVANLDISKSRIRSDRLFQRLDVPNMPSGLHVQPAVTCAAESTTYRAGLTLATAGVGSSFTIQSKDAYENTREDTSASFTLSVHGSGGTPVYAGAVVPNAPSIKATYTASFELTNAKGYEVFVKHGNENVKGSPFSLVVKPAGACGTTSTVQGTGLTASALSPAKSAFTIQARDMYGNTRTQGAPIGSQYVVRVVRTSGANQQGTNGPPAMYGSTAHDVTGTLQGMFNQATNDGRFSGYYQVPTTPDPAVLSHYLYASYANVGGVHATYYTTANSGASYSAPINRDVSAVNVRKHLTQLGTNGAITTAAAAATNLWGSSAIAMDVDYVIRWNGFYKSTNQTTRYFKWDAGTINSDRVRMWIDNVLIIDQWTSLATTMTSKSAGRTLDIVDALYDVQVEYYRRAGSVSTSAELKDSNDNIVFSSITSDRLYYQEKISGSPYAVSVSC